LGSYGIVIDESALARPQSLAFLLRHCATGEIPQPAREARTLRAAKVMPANASRPPRRRLMPVRIGTAAVVLSSSGWRAYWPQHHSRPRESRAHAKSSADTLTSVKSPTGGDPG